MKRNNYKLDILMKLCFIVILVGIFFNLRLDQLFFSGPSGIHFTRQTDSLAFASQYFNTGNNFINPSLYNLESIDGRAACEFPILYYISSLYYSFFGENFYILKLLNLIILFTGLYAVFNISFKILKDYFYAILIPLLLFTSTVFNYYAFNYLPDTGALGFTLIGWFYFLKYDLTQRKKNLLFSAIFFTLGSLIKITFLINPLSIVVFYLGSWIFKKYNNLAEFKSILLYFTTGVLLVIAWNLYIVSYNSMYNSEYFTTSSRAIWSISAEERSNVWYAISNYWYSSYFAHSTHHLILALGICQFLAFRILKPKLFWISTLLFGGSLAFFILFYSQFRDHDYYFITLIPALLFITINGIVFIKKISSKLIIQVGFKLIFLIIFIAGINYSKGKLIERHKASPDIHSITGLTIQNELAEIEKLNIPADAFFVITPERSKNGSLFFLNRSGWHFNETKELTQQKIIDLKTFGADYLLYNTDNTEALEIASREGKLIYSSDKLKIYKLNVQ